MLTTLQWLQSKRQVELFDEIFVHHSPRQVLTNVSSLVLLSIAATVTTSLKTNVVQRIDWLEIALQLINPKVSNLFLRSQVLWHLLRVQQDEAFVGYFTNIMDVITVRLHKTYMEIAEANSNAQVLRRIHAMAQKAAELKNLAGLPTFATSAGAAV